MYPFIYDKSVRNDFSVPSETLVDKSDIEKVNYSKSGNWQWFEPPQNSAPVRFFMDTSLHGLQYLGQSKRHVCERIFWFIAFTAAVITSFLLISEMLYGYIDYPLVTVFNPTEKTIDQIPFPAVTICNVNNVKRSIYEKNRREAELGLNGGGVVSNETLLKRLATAYDIYQICHSAKTFTDKFKTEPKPLDQFGHILKERNKEYIHLQNPIETLRQSSQSCEEMIRFCLWLSNVTDCTELFEEIETDYGICCTFNMIPVTLLKHHTNAKDNRDRVTGWSESKINYDNLLLDADEDREYPYRQFYAGRSAGLSILLDPELEEYHCTNTDSEGFVVALHLPLDFPRIKDNGNAVRTSSEVFISVRPEITMSAMSAKEFSLKTCFLKEKRQCYYDGEMKLPHYTQYTASNCLDECIAYRTLKDCKCIRYYMPSSGNLKMEPICEPAKYECTENVRDQIILKGLDQECKDCWPSCSEILYHAEVTSLKIKEKSIDELFESHPDKRKPKNPSIVHIYFNVDPVFPRLMKEKSTIIELISNAGGLLGLCMGFSMLSLLEIIYYFTIRQLCDFYKKRIGRNDDQKDRKVSDDIGMKNEFSRSANERNIGFLSKIINHQQQDSQVETFKDPRHHNNDGTDEGGKIFYRVRNQSGNPSTLSDNFRTPFEADFQRTYYATTWLQQRMS